MASHISLPFRSVVSCLKVQPKFELQCEILSQWKLVMHFGLKKREENAREIRLLGLIRNSFGNSLGVMISNESSADV